MGTSRSWSKLWGAGAAVQIVVSKHARGDRTKFRSKLLWAALEGQSPREQPVVGVLNTRSAARDSSVGLKPRNRSSPSRPLHLACKGIQASERYVGSSEPETARWPAERRKLRRANPRSAAGAKQNRHGFEGSKPSRGSPNPEGGTWWAGESPREADLRFLRCCRESKPMRGVGRLRPTG